LTGFNQAIINIPGGFTGIKDIPLDDRPREKLILRGAENLTDAELLAILLRTGTKGKSVVEIARDLINLHTNLAVLATKSYNTIAKISGIKKDKAAALLAAFEISRRILHQQRWYNQQSVTSPDKVAEIFIPLFKDEVKEKFTVVCLNSANKIIKFETISVGSLNASIVHPREVFKTAIENNSASVLLMHNHPSGNPEPSSEDIAITRKLREGGTILGIPVVDHIIIAGNNYLSFMEKGLI